MHSGSVPLPPDQIEASALMLWEHWQQQRRLDELPAMGRPATRADGYAIQAALARVSGQPVAGWKIAATSAAGQAHIQVDGPLAGRLLDGRVLASGSAVPLDGNLMRVAEAEFVFRVGRDLGPRDRPYETDEVLAAVDALYLGIEVPDSRFHDFTRAGAPQLIADNACAAWFILGPRVEANWRDADLARHNVAGYLNDAHAASGSGANVLGDPRIALTWIVNELRQFGEHIRAGQIVTTGTCLTPIAVAPGDRVRMDFGPFGLVDARCR